jgi:hypothetical protein
MRAFWSTLLALTVGCVFVLGALAAEKADKADKKEVTLKGDVLCAKCELKQARKCQTAIEVKEGDKKVVYYFKDKGAKETYHEEVCGGGRKAATVTGTVVEEGGKKWIVPPIKVEYAKK